MAAPDNPDRVLLFNIVMDNMPQNLRNTLAPLGINGMNIVTHAITDIVNGHLPLQRDELLPGGHHLNMIFATIERMLGEIPQAPQAPQEQPADAPADAAADIFRNGGRRRYKTSKKSKKRPTRRGRSSKARKARTTRRK